MSSAGSSGSTAFAAGLVTARVVGVALAAAIVRADLEAGPAAGRLAGRAFEFAIGDVSSEIGTM
jgi:hypothetical protein